MKNIKESNFKFSTCLLIMTFLVLTIISCKKEDSTEICIEEDFGTFNLLDNSINSVPYKSNTKMYFQDDVGNQVQFELEYEKGGYENIDTYYKTTCEYDANLEKVYKTNIDYYQYNMMETSSSLNLRFSLQLKVEPFSLNFGELVISDQLWINKGLDSDTTASAGVLSILVNSRDLAEIDNNLIFAQPIDEINLLGRTFQNVFTNNDSSFFYNYEIGVIAFKDLDGKLWALDKTEIEE